MSEPLKIYLIAGEPSGDLLASRLMRALKKQTNGAVAFYGVGGETMRAEGLTSLFPISDLAVMGFLEVLPSIPKILRRIRQTLDDIEKVKPDIVVTVDSWSFSIKIHQGLKKRHAAMPHIHYVAPQVWAWKAKRAQQIKKWVDHLLMLLPFEKKYFDPYGMPSTYVGHPVIEGGADKGNGTLFREKHGIAADAFVMTVLPGSRKNEVQYLLPVFEQVTALMKRSHPNLRVVIPTVETVSDFVREMTASWPVPVTIVMGERERYDAFAASSIALAASGTVSLELSMAGVPHVIAYHVNRLSAWLARRLLKIKYVNLINILADEEIIPELLQESCNPNQIVCKLEELINVSGGSEMKKARRILSKLGQNDALLPSEKAGLCIRDLIKTR